jgi:hypothetical protein
MTSVVNQIEKIDQCLAAARQAKDAADMHNRLVREWQARWNTWNSQKSALDSQLRTAEGQDAAYRRIGSREVNHNNTKYNCDALLRQYGTGCHKHVGGSCHFFGDTNLAPYPHCNLCGYCENSTAGQALTKCQACGIVNVCDCAAGQPSSCHNRAQCTSLFKQDLTISPYQSTIARLKQQIAALGVAPPPPPPFQLVQNIQCQVCTAVVDLSGIRADAQSTVDIGKIDNAINCMQNQRTAAVAEQQRQEAAAAERERQAKLEAERLAAAGRAREAELAAQRAAAAEAERLRLQQEAAAAAERTRIAQEQKIAAAKAERAVLDQQAAPKNNMLIFLLILLFVVFSFIVGLSVYYFTSSPEAVTV